MLPLEEVKFLLDVFHMESLANMNSRKVVILQYWTINFLTDMHGAHGCVLISYMHLVPISFRCIITCKWSLHHILFHWAMNYSVLVSNELINHPWYHMSHDPILFHLTCNIYQRKYAVCNQTDFIVFPYLCCEGVWFQFCSELCSFFPFTETRTIVH